MNGSLLPGIDDENSTALDGGKYILKSCWCRCEEERQRRFTEPQLHRALSGHASLVRYSYAWCDPDGRTLHMLLEHHGLELWSWVFSLGDEPFPDELKLKWCMELAEGVLHMYRHNVLHRNISPWSIFVRPGGPMSYPHVVIGDFGMACRLLEKGEPEEPYRFLDEVVVESKYSAPELETGCKEHDVLYDFSSDIFSLGMIFFFIWDSPKPEQVLTERMDAIKKAGALPEDVPFSPAMCDLLAQMVRREPRQRIGIVDVLATLGSLSVAAPVGDQPKPPSSVVPCRRVPG